MVVKRGCLQDNTVIGLDTQGDLNQLAFKGTQNKVFFHHNAVSKGCNITFFGSNGIFEVHAGAVVQGDFFISDQAIINIGEQTILNKKCVFRVTSGQKIQIGAECLFANVKFSTADDLPIFDVISHKRQNPAADILVEDRVWIAENTRIDAGAKIGHDSVIGAWSMVMGGIPAHCVAAGNPAQVVKTNIVWKK